MKAIDHITLPATGLAKVETVHLGVSCDLMENHLPASPVSAIHENILVAEDDHGKPMIFSIGDAGQFRLFRFKNGTEDGYLTFDLMAAFPIGAKAITFDLSQALNGNLTLIIGIQATSGQHDVYVAQNLSNQPEQVDWKNPRGLFKRIVGLPLRFRPDSFELGTTDAGKPAAAIITGVVGGGEYAFLLLGNRIVQRHLPENVHGKSMLDISTGFAFGQVGDFFLYREGQSQSLVCVTRKDQYSGSETYDYSPGYRSIPADLQFNCMTTFTGNADDSFSIASDLYVGTNKGIIRFAGGKVEDLETVTDTIPDVHQIIVREDAESIAIWAIASPNLLWYILGKKGAHVQWHDPIMFSRDALHVAPIRSRIAHSNELFTVNQAQHIVHYWQDPHSTLWNNRTLKIKSDPYLLGFKSFTSHFSFTDQNENPIFHQTVEIRSSQWIYVVANGKYYSLEKDVPAEIPTDGFGSITVIQATKSIAPPVLHLSAPFLEEQINVYASGKIVKRLHALKNGTDLKNAKYPDGGRVFPQKYNQSTMDGFSHYLIKLTTKDKALRKGENTGEWTFCTLSRPGVDFEEFTAIPAFPEALVTEFSAKGKLHFWATVGDIFRHLETYVEEGVKLIAKGEIYLEKGISVIMKPFDGILHLVISLAKKVIVLALKQLAFVLKGINWLLGLFGLSIGKILKFLGFDFGWSKTWAMHKTLADSVRNGLEFGVEWSQAHLPKWKTDINKFLDGIEGKIEHLILPEKVRHMQPRKQKNGHKEARPLKQSAGENWMRYHLMHTKMAEGTKGAPPTHLFNDFINDVVIPTVKTIKHDLKKDFEQMYHMLSTDDYTLEAFFTLVKDLLNTIFDPLKALVDGFLEVLVDALKYMRTGLESESDIPFITAIYKWLVDVMGEQEKASLLNITAFLVAVPLHLVSPQLFKDHKRVSEKGFFQKLVGDTPLETLAYAPAELGSVEAETSAWDTWSKISGNISGIVGMIDAILNMVYYSNDKKEVPDYEKKVRRWGASVGVYTMNVIYTFPAYSPKGGASAYAWRIGSYLSGVGFGLWGIILTEPEQEPAVENDWEVVQVISESVVCLVLNIVANIKEYEHAKEKCGEDHDFPHEFPQYVIDILPAAGAITQVLGEKFDQEEVTIAGMCINLLAGLIDVIEANEEDDDEDDCKLPFTFTH